MIKFLVIINLILQTIPVKEVNEVNPEVQMDFRYIPRSFSSESNQKKTDSAEQFYPNQSIEEEEGTLNISVEEISETMLDSFLLSRDTDVNASVIDTLSSFHEIKKNFNYKQNNCSFQTKIQLLKFDMVDDKRTEAKDKNYNGQEVKMGFELEITEQIMFPNGLVKKEIIKEKRMLKSEVIKLKKNGDFVRKGKYLIILKKKGIYFKKESEKDKKVKLFEKDLNEIQSSINNDIMLQYQGSFLNNIEDDKKSVIYRVFKIPCDTNLPITKLVNSYSTNKEKKDVTQGAFCMTKTSIQHYVGIGLEFEISFLNKYHITEGADYFRNYYLGRKNIFDKFKSIPYKTQIE